MSTSDGPPETWLQDVAVETARDHERQRCLLIQQLKDKLAEQEASSQDADLLRLTLEFLGAWHLPPSPPMVNPKDIRAATIAALAATLQRSIGHLERLSNSGDRDAVNLFARHVLRVSSELSRLRKKKANLLKPVARESVFWPVLKSRCQHFDDTGKALDQAHAVILRDLDVGRDHPIQGYKVKLSDELGNLTLELVQEVQNYKALGYIFKMPTGWRLDAMKLPNLTRDARIVEMWTKVLKSVLSERFLSPGAMARKYKHLVSPNKRLGTGTVLAELHHLIRGRLRGIAGLGRKSKGNTPVMVHLLASQAAQTVANQL